MMSANIIEPRLMLVAWEITKSCNLFCAHCRGASDYIKYSDELSTEECFRVVDDILKVGKPILILTGGEPLARPDALEIGKYAVSRGLRVVMGSNGTMVTPETAARMKDVPISRLAVSLDFPTAALQDSFRGKAGAYEAALAGIAHARADGIEVQINCTVTRLNVGYLDDILALGMRMGIVSFHPFLLVPTGRGKGLESVELSPQQYEDTLNWIYDRQLELGDRVSFKPTDAPHYMRVMKQRQKQGDMPAIPPKAGEHTLHSTTRGCLAGIGFCFISHRGRVQGCGYLDVEAGNVRQQPFDKVWFGSPLFNDLRNLDNMKGKCGACEYRRICGGCRARAYEATGDYLEAEPYCIYRPISEHRNAVEGSVRG
ncbi:MAG: radical SAM protein [Chloroflexi bacterium]|nr:radical SAM protein [Chloroflexota bacterium]